MSDSDSLSLTYSPISETPTEDSAAEQTVEFTVQFWGVRGSIPTPGADTVRYGGNTACVEIMVAGKRLIFDGGTGLRILGKHLFHQRSIINAHIFFTHTHWDRIQGFPFFIPAFTEGNCFHIYGAAAANGASIKQCLTDQMLRPNFFTPLQEMRSEMKFFNISAGNIIPIDDIIVETISLNRSTSALGYRVTWQGHSVVYATDTDHCLSTEDQNLLYLAHQADLLIYDGSYTDSPHPDKGRDEDTDLAPWRVGVEIARNAGVRQLIMFHHSPAHDDNSLDYIEMEIQTKFSNARLAREGMILQIA